MRGVVRGERPSWGRRRCLPAGKGSCPARPPEGGGVGGDGMQGGAAGLLVQLSLGHLGGREAPGSFGFRQEAACSYLPCTSCAPCPEALGGAPPGEPQVGTVPPAADKPALAERAGPTSAPQPVSWALQDLGV